MFMSRLSFPLCSDSVALHSLAPCVHAKSPVAKTSMELVFIINYKLFWAWILSG